MKFQIFANMGHYFSWCDWMEGVWRARMKTRPKMQRAEASLQRFHAQNPEPVNVAKGRMDCARRKARQS